MRLLDRLNPQEDRKHGQGREFMNSLLAEIRSRLERLSEAQHRLARDRRILSDAATRLRLGRSAEVVLAEIRDQRAEPGATKGLLRHSAHCPSASAIDWPHRGLGVKTGGTGQRVKERERMDEVRRCRR
jgi:hypothetical protein